MKSLYRKMTDAEIRALADKAAKLVAINPPVKKAAKKKAKKKAERRRG